MSHNPPIARTKSEADGLLVDAQVDQAVSMSPSAIKPYMEMAAPVLKFAGRCANRAGPYFDKAWIACEKFYVMIEPYHPEEVLPMFLGIIMMLFGGHFMMFIACVEAYRLSGWDHTKDHLWTLWQNYKAVKLASKDDDMADEDHDGIADVLEISKEELVTRKFKLFLRTADPVAMSNALSGLYTGFIAVLAVLKLQFARTIALGVAIGDTLSKPALKFFGPPLRFLIPEPYHKWVDVGIRYFCKVSGVWIAMTLQRILSAFHSALRGAQIFTDAFAVYTARLGYYHLSVGYWDEAFSVVVCTVGLTNQLKNAFVLPWFLSLLLFPFLIVERLLEYLVVYQAL